ncbi:MAG: SPASM domain-containing protein [Clostridia bacterium]|nr:SPASM domain-containing protein [Clostridia bacterium]
MILSKYNFYQNQNNYWIVYNSASSNCLVMTNSDYQKFYNINGSEEDKKQYLLLGFYVYENENEVNKLIENSNHRLSHFTKKKFRVLTTTACNARCPYCYEEGVCKVSMNQQTATSVANFILEQSQNVKAIEIEWFGGEPLLNTSAIDTICSIIKQKKRPELRFESSIVSNASMIDSNLIQKMINDWNIYQIQITIDGLKEEYERVKALGEGSFEKLIHILEMLCETKIKVVIRLNFDKNNVEELKNLINYLSTLPFSKKLEVYPAKINDGKQRTQFILENETIQMYKHLHDAGFMTKLKLLPRTLKTPCAAVHNGYYTINADGNLFKCDRKLLAGNSVGSVYEPLKINKEITTKWENLSLPERCYQCKLFPLCWGGCIYERIMGQDFCYITENIVNNNLNLILSDYLKENV